MHVVNTTPYAWPYDATIDPDRTALLVAGGGDWAAQRLHVDGPVAARIDALRSRLPGVGVLVVLVDHHPVHDRTTIVDGPAPRLTTHDGELAVAAAGIDGFYGSRLDAVLRARGRTHLLLCGYGFETTVHSTLRRANDRGYECLTIADACLPHDPRLAAASRSTIEMSGGIFGAVGSTVDVLDAFDAAPDPTTTDRHPTEETHP